MPLPPSAVLPSIFLFLYVFSGCPGKGASEDRPPAKQSDTISRITVFKDSHFLFSYFDPQAELRTVDEISLISKTSLAEVMVVDPRSRLPGDLIWVADLRTPRTPVGDFKVWLEPKSSWLDRVMPKKSLLDKKEIPRSKKPKAVAKKPRRPVGTAKGEEDSKKRYDVVMFSTAWCPSCKAARAFFQQRGIKMLDLDIERDAEAASEYERIVKAAGLKAQAVPVIIVRGKVFQGFSAPQMEAALGG